MIRLPDGMRDELKEAAEQNGRSMNAEIVARIEEHPRLSRLKMDADYLKLENERLVAELTEAKSSLDEVRFQKFALQELMKQRRQSEELEAEGLSSIEERFNELKEQTNYLESLKAELLELAKDHDDLDNSSNEDHLIIRLPQDLAEKINQAAELMKRTMEDQAIDTLEKSYLPPRYLK